MSRHTCVFGSSLIHFAFIGVAPPRLFTAVRDAGKMVKLYNVHCRYFPAQQALQMALGNINLHNMETLLPEIDPDLLLSRENVSVALRPQVTHKLISRIGHVDNIPTI